jgi:hypothetical protein
MDLAQAVQAIDQVAQRAREDLLEPDALATHLGHKRARGGAASAISALTKYNMLTPEKRGRKTDLYRISDMARSLLNCGAQDAERFAILRRMLRKPEAFRDLAAAFGELVLVPDEYLCRYLETRRFTPDGARGCAINYRSSVSYVRSHAVGETSGPAPASSFAGWPAGIKSAPREGQLYWDTTFLPELFARFGQLNGKVILQCDLAAPSCSCRVTVYGQLTWEAMERLLNHLLLTARSYPDEQALLAEAEREQGAMQPPLITPLWFHLGASMACILLRGQVTRQSIDALLRLLHMHLDRLPHEEVGTLAGENVPRTDMTDFIIASMGKFREQ